MVFTVKSVLLHLHQSSEQENIFGKNCTLLSPMLIIDWHQWEFEQRVTFKLKII